MPYRNWVDTDVVNAADLNAMVADAVTSEVVTAEATASSSYTDLATVGPSVSLTLVTGQGCLVFISARALNDADVSTSAATASFAVSGAGTLAASDSNGIQAARAAGICVTRATWYVAGSTGSYTFTMKYKRIGTGNANFTERRILVKKF